MSTSDPLHESLLSNNNQNEQTTISAAIQEDSQDEKAADGSHIQEKQLRSRDRPESRRKLCLSLFFLLGVGLMVPWNAFIASEPYFNSRLCKSDNSFLRSNFEAIFALVFNLSNVGALCVLLYLQNRASQDLDGDDLSIGSNSTISTVGEMSFWFRKKMCDLRDYVSVNLFCFRKRDDASVVVDAGEGSDFYHPPSVLSTIDEGESEGSDPTYESFRFGNNEATLNNDSNNDETEEDFLAKLINPSLAAYTAVFIFACGMVLNTSLSSNMFFVWTNVLIVICGIACSIASAGLFSLAEIFSVDDQMIKTLFLAGQTMAGLFIAFVNLLSVSSSGFDYDKECGISGDSDSNEEDEICEAYTVDWGAESTFLVTALMLALCIAGFGYLIRLPITTYLRSSHCKSNVNLGCKNLEENDEANSKTNTEASTATPALQESALGSSSNADTPSSVLQQIEWGSESVVAWEDILESDQQSIDGVVDLLQVIWRPALTVFINYLVTLAIFPVWTSKLESTGYCELSSSRVQNDLFQPLLLVTFNAFDLCGKFAAGKLISKVTSGKGLLYSSFARFILFPCFLLCNASDSSNAVLFNYDGWPFLFMALLGISNGCVSSMGMMHGTALVESAKHKEHSSTIMMLCLCFGLLLGSFVSFVVLRIGTGSW